MERKLFRKSMSKNVPVMFAIFFLYFMISDSIDIVIPLYLKNLILIWGYTADCCPSRKSCGRLSSFRFPCGQ